MSHPHGRRRAPSATPPRVIFLILLRNTRNTLHDPANLPSSTCFGFARGIRWWCTARQWVWRATSRPISQQSASPSGHSPPAATRAPAPATYPALWSDARPTRASRSAHVSARPRTPSAAPRQREASARAPLTGPCPAGRSPPGGQQGHTRGRASRKARGFAASESAEFRGAQARMWVART